MRVDTSGTVAIERTGDFKYVAGTSVPNGWLPADGSAVSRTEYANLFAEIGTTYGVGDGTATFNLPDLRGRCAIPPPGTSGRITGIGTSTGSAGGTEGVTLAGNPGGSGEEVGQASLNAGSGIAAGTGFENVVSILGAEQPHNNMAIYLASGHPRIGIRHPLESNCFVFTAY